jgi:hypothetical protein
MNSTPMTQRWETVRMHHWSLNLLKNVVICHQTRVQEETVKCPHTDPLTGIPHSLKVSSEVFLESSKEYLKVSSEAFIESSKKYLKVSSKAFIESSKKYLKVSSEAFIESSKEYFKFLLHET